MFKKVRQKQPTTTNTETFVLLIAPGWEYFAGTGSER